MRNNSVSDSFSPGFCEYLVDGFADKTVKIIRIAAIVIGVVLCFFLFQLLSFIPQVFAVWLVVIAAFEVMLFRATKREFEYTVAMGEMTVDTIYGKRWRRKLVTLRLADADRIFPVNSFKDEQIGRLGASKIYFAAPKNSEYLYCLYINNAGEKNSGTAVVFSSCKKLNDAIRFYNRAALSERV